MELWTITCHIYKCNERTHFSLLFIYLPSRTVLVDFNVKERELFSLLMWRQLSISLSIQSQRSSNSFNREQSSVLNDAQQLLPRPTSPASWSIITSIQWRAHWATINKHMLRSSDNRLIALSRIRSNRRSR